MEIKEVAKWSRYNNLHIFNCKKINGVEVVVFSSNKDKLGVLHLRQEYINVNNTKELQSLKEMYLSRKNDLLMDTLSIFAIKQEKNEDVEVVKY